MSLRLHKGQNNIIIIIIVIIIMFFAHILKDDAMQIKTPVDIDTHTPLTWQDIL